jgi:phosphatidylglycerophosphate synthase
LTSPSLLPTAFVVRTPSAPTDPVGGLTIVERWRRSLRAHGIQQLIELPLAELPQALGQTTSGALIVWDHSVAEHLAIERFVESTAEASPSESRSLMCPSLTELAPIVFVGSEVVRSLTAVAAAELADVGTTTETLRRVGYAPNQDQVPEGFWAHVTDKQSAKHATWKLLDRLRWRPGGLVAKHLNRPISTRLSYLIIDTPITPNQTTVVAFIIGAVGVGLIFMGGYVNTIVGTFLLQMNSVVDGIDGELARVRHQNSDFGAYLDSVCDEILNSGTMIGVGYNLSTYVYGGKPLYLVAGLLAGVTNFLYALVHWHCKWKHGLGFYWWFEAYKPRREVHRSTSAWSYVKKLTMKESYLFLFFIASIFGFMEVILWPFAVVSVLVLTLFIIHIPIKRARW